MGIVLGCVSGRSDIPYEFNVQTLFFCPLGIHFKYEVL